MMLFVLSTSMKLLVFNLDSKEQVHVLDVAEVLSDFVSQ